jgi:acyl-CoA thioester hydrolase
VDASFRIRRVKSDYRFHHDIRVRFADTDLQAIVFNGNYMTYYDVAWTEYFRALGFSYEGLLETGADTVLARTTIEFKSPARFDEVLQIFTRVTSIKTSSMVFDFEIYPEGEDRLVNTASSVYVCIDPKTLRPVPVPQLLRSRISEFEGREM